VVSFTSQPLYPQGKDPPGTHWIGGWVGPRGGLETEAKRKIFCSCRESKPGCPATSHYTDWANKNRKLILFVNFIRLPDFIDSTVILIIREAITAAALRRVWKRIAGSNPALGMDARIFCVVLAEALRRADPPTKESYRSFKIFQVSEQCWIAKKTRWPDSANLRTRNKCVRSQKHVSPSAFGGQEDSLPPVPRIDLNARVCACVYVCARAQAAESVWFSEHKHFVWQDCSQTAWNVLRWALCPYGPSCTKLIYAYTEFQNKSRS
jgi:hypothetical protein